MPLAPLRRYAAALSLVVSPVLGAAALAQPASLPPAAEQVAPAPPVGAVPVSADPSVRDGRPSESAPRSPNGKAGGTPTQAIARTSTCDERWTGRDWAAVIAGLASVLAFFAALWSTYHAQRANRASMAQKANETELAAIELKLDGFFGPYLQLSETNRLLQLDLRDRQPDPKAFRTMIMLLDPGWRDALSPGDRTIVEEIIRIDGQLELSIRRNAGLVDAALLPYLARASAHFRMIRLAFRGKLDNDPARYAKYVYPRSLNAVLDLEAARLQERRNLLRANPDKLLPPLPALAVPSKLGLDDWSAPRTPVAAPAVS